MKLNCLKLSATIVLLCVLVTSFSSVAVAEKYATYGDGVTETVFYVNSDGDASITFQQEKGKCQELSYTKLISGLTGEAEEWGKYHVYYTIDGITYQEDWDSTHFGQSFKLKLNRVGEYTIRVEPYTSSELTESYLLDQFVGWETPPTWWISRQERCVCSAQKASTPSCPISIEYEIWYQDLNGNRLETEHQVWTSGQSSVTAQQVKTGFTADPLSTYELVGTNVQYFSFDSCGNLTPNPVVFYYNKVISTPSNPNNGGTNQSAMGTIVAPYQWDTQFKPGTATATSDGNVSNGDRYKLLPYLSDNNVSTSFWWLIWRSERTDSIPEITAFFSGETINSIGIRNGNLRSSYTYYQYARVAQLRVKIFQTNGCVFETTIHLADMYSTDYQVCYLGSTYSDVSRVELFLDGGDQAGFYAGNEETYYIHIADLQFYR